MKFHEAVLKMKEGDIFEPDDSIFCKCELLEGGTFQDPDDKQPIFLNNYHFYIEGEIIPAEPKILTATESFLEYKGDDSKLYRRPDREFVIGFNRGKSQGRLEYNKEIKKSLKEMETKCIINMRILDYILNNLPMLSNKQNPL